MVKMKSGSSNNMTKSCCGAKNSSLVTGTVNNLVIYSSTPTPVMMLPGISKISLYIPSHLCC